ncbi:hypothetical protein BH10BAC3_BH10BAC3_03810 [soil metagenome]
MVTFNFKLRNFLMVNSIAITFYTFIIMKRIIILLLLLPMISLAQPKKMLSFSFTLPRAATVSAGVYNGDVLVRTLFNNKQYAAGTHSESMAALDDEMNSINSTDGLTVKVLSNNVKYEWEGVIGNTSAEKSGMSIHRGFMPVYYLIVNEGKAYYSKYYSEGTPAQNMFELKNIQVKKRLFPDEPRGVGQATAAIATDGKYVYWGGSDPFGGKTKGNIKFANYVFATKVSDDAEVDFTRGNSYKNGIGRTYKSALDLTTDSASKITGLAVQKRGDFLFVSHGYNLHILNKNSGELLKIITMPSSALAVDMKDNLWIATAQYVKKYSVGSDGNISPLLSLPIFVQPIAVAVTPDDNTVVVSDAGSSQQLKAFSNISGKSVWTFGQEGGYYKSAAVTNDKFYFSDSRMNYGTSLSFEKDGSFWVVDGGNCRVQHYGADRKFIERIMYLPHNYNMYVDPKVPERVFCDYLEFAVDYSKPLSPENGSWTFVNNWGANITKDRDNKFMSLRPMKFSNGRTYTLLADIKNKRYEIVELTPAGQLRFTGTYMAGTTGTYLNADGNIYKMPRKNVGSPMVFTKQPVKGFDATGNPLWGPDETIAKINNPGNDDPAYGGNTSTLKPGEKTNSNILLVFNGSGRGEGFHLGGVKVGDDHFTWRAAKATTESYKGPFPTDGTYDIGNGVQYAGNVALALEKNIFWGYHGEFWKQSQTNKWNHLYDNGLMIGQFGVTGPEVADQEAAPGMAGNVSAASIVKVGETIYLYHNDEGHHSGVHRWKVTGLNTISEQVLPVTFIEKKDNKGRVALTGKEAYDKINDDGLDGWKKQPANDIELDRNRNWWSVKTGSKTYNKFEGSDINIRFRQSAESQASLSKNLGSFNTENWSLTGEINYDENFPEIESSKAGVESAGGQYLEISDANGKIIFRFFPLIDAASNSIKLMANKTVVAQGEQAALTKELKQFQPFTIRLQNGRLFFKYSDFAEKQLMFFDAGANGKTPSVIRFYFWAKGKASNRVVSFKNFEFNAE